MASIDYRLPQYRREAFLKFYEFHLKYKAHPGAVYYVLPALQKMFSLTQEDMLTLCFINGVTQNIVTTWLFFSKFPTLAALNSPAFSAYFREHYLRFFFDTDRKWEKNKLERHLANYMELLRGGSQVDFFGEHLQANDAMINFQNIWKLVIERFSGFGRLATFSYTEYLRIIGLPLQCSTLFLDDIDGSRSHRNGLCLVIGQDTWIMDKVLNPNPPTRFKPAAIEWLREEADKLLEETPDHPDKGYFTLESTLCCYKSWHKPRRRYPNVYNDMFHDRIRYAEAKWGNTEDFSVFWQIRRDWLPLHLRVEDCPRDPGLKTVKQNHYLTTGEVIMMDHDFPEFENSHAWELPA